MGHRKLMKGILFTQENFQAIIDGRKTQTRRIVKLQKWADGIEIGAAGKPFAYIEKYRHTDDARAEFIKPRYKVGERVYLKEPYCLDCDFIQHEFSKEWKANGKIRYKYSGDELSELSRLVGGFNRWENKLFMPEKYARYFIEITDVHCERLQDISDEDCLKEGIKPIPQKYNGAFIYNYGRCNCENTPKRAYAALFDKINGKGTWEKNPFVWVYSYKLVKI